MLLALLIFTTCSEESSSTGPSTEPSMETVTISGSLNIPDGSTVQTDDLEVTTFATSEDLDGEGNFEIETPAAEKNQIVLFMSKNNNNPVYLGIYDPLVKNITANDTTTALALTLFNPYLIYSDQAQRTEYLDAVQTNVKFEDLLTELNAAYINDAETALDYETNPIVYQLVAELTQETLESLGGRDDKPIGDPPYIEDAEGDDITFISPRFVWYAAGINNLRTKYNDVVNINRQETVMSFNWGFPPYVETEPAQTNYDLGDGSFEIFLTKGGDFNKLDEWNDPVGRATILNTAQAILYLSEIIIGNMPEIDLSTIQDYFEISDEMAAQLQLDINQGNTQKFLMHFCTILEENSDQIANWIWQDNQFVAAPHYFAAISNIFERVSFVFQLFGYDNEQGPFFFDMIFAPQNVTYNITQEDGTIINSEFNDAPMAEFNITPPAGIIGTEFTFDASETSDDNDLIDDLNFRWDWQSDGTWDTNWSNDYMAYHTYDESGSYSITLEVKDTEGLSSTVVHGLNVGGGAGTANHVKLFRDNLPWSSNAMIEMLESLGFTEGLGENTYEIISSSEFATVPLIPGEDLIIISNDQAQTFYNNYAASQTRFTNFVYMGGSLFWEACDEGWAGGSMADAGVILPGNIDINLNYDNWNYVTDQNLPLVSGLPDAMDHNYASHENFSNLPDGTTVYCVDSQDEATLIEFNLGGGWILISGQPLEHQYDYVYGADEMSELLPRIASYFTGKDYSKNLLKQTIKESGRNSH